jgi:hypothetical protein
MLTDRPPGGIFPLSLEHSSGFSYTTTLSRPAQFSSFLVAGEAKCHPTTKQNLERLIVSNFNGPTFTSGLDSQPYA